MKTVRRKFETSEKAVDYEEANLVIALLKCPVVKWLKDMMSILISKVLGEGVRLRLNKDVMEEIKKVLNSKEEVAQKLKLKKEKSRSKVKQELQAMRKVKLTHQENKALIKHHSARAAHAEQQLKETQEKLTEILSKINKVKS